MHQIFHTPCGSLDIFVEEGKLVRCKWIDYITSDQKDTNELAAVDNASTGTDGIIIDSVIIQLQKYFRGIIKSFRIDYELKGTEFQKLVWKEISKIPYGQTVSYKSLAEKIGRPAAVRAVANACRLNPLCIIIPCHRVIGSNGDLTGYNGGLHIKEYMLRLERN
ncbi:MAG: methylated-DNA--[protein]-cysteine S-methyltransferase [Muribaculum sp.]|nr:methylated-DNA--[protein]-cysteine S-methyltransferase [Muribaculum sp.]